MTLAEVRKRLQRAFGDLEFCPVSHIYRHKGKKLVSTTTSIKKYHKHFDEDLWAERCVKKYSRKLGRPVTADEIKLMWAEKRDQAATFGHDVHAYAENWPKVPPPSNRHEEGIVDYLTHLPKHVHIICKELKVHDRTYGGTIDLPLWDTRQQVLIQDDWKTNEDLFRSFGYMDAPFDDLPNQPMSHYYIQLNRYRDIIDRMTGIPTATGRIIWLDGRKGDGWDKAGHCWVRYPIPDLRSRLRSGRRRKKKKSRTSQGYGANYW